MTGALAARDDPLESSEFEQGDFSRLALDLIFRIHAAHPRTVDFKDKSESAIAEPQVKQLWRYLKHQGIVVGELTEAGLSPTGHQSVKFMLELNLQAATATEHEPNTPVGKSASTLLLGLMRHHFALQTDAH